MRLLVQAICFSLLCWSTALGHPVSHTDAWVRVGNVVDVRLNIFLDDVVRHQIGDPSEHEVVAAATVQKAIVRHTGALLNQLRIFDHTGAPLTASVTAMPKWRPTTPDVILSENNLLKLTWKIRFSAGGQVPADSWEPATLCFLHSFTHATLNSPGELRLHLQHAESGRRIDAVVAPGRPHTIVLPKSEEGAGSTVSNLNSATSRIVVAPTGIVHEFTAPLLLLDEAWAPAEELRRKSSDPAGSIPAFIASSNLDESKQLIADWFTAHALLYVDGVLVRPEAVSVELLAAGESLEVGDATASPASSEVPLLGTLAGVRLRYSPINNLQGLKLSFLKSPGAFEELTTEFISANGESSELVRFVTSEGGVSSELALQFEWSAETVVRPDVRGSKPSSSSPLPFRNPLGVTSDRPSFKGTVYGLCGLLFLCGFAYAGRGSMSLAKGASLVLAGVALLVVCMLAIPTTTVIVNEAEVKDLTEDTLSSVYDATMQSSEREAVAALSNVLEQDLVEEVYLGMLKSLSTSSEDGLLIDVSNVLVTSFSVPSSPTSPDLVQGNCEWTVQGIVHHWGHRHSRDFRLTGDITLARHAKHWKIRAISQTEVH